MDMDIQPDIVLLLRGLYLSAAASVLLVFAIPALRRRFLDYGPRSTAAAATAPCDGNTTGPSALLNSIAELKVPHSWFTSFYAVSVTASVFWASQLLTKGPSFKVVAGLASHRSQAMTFRQVMVVWAIMFAQGGRRLYECLTVSRPSTSRMWVGHWILGILFYVGTSLAVWVEGIPSIEAKQLSARDFAFEAPNVRTFIGFLLFLLASGLQYDCHAYLASLKNSGKKAGPSAKPEYRLPDHPAFNISLTPHYFAECVIYASLAIVAAPDGDLLNWTLVTAFIFVVVNLGVTAHGTKQWYEQKFGPDAVKSKAKMLPFIF